MPRPENRDLRDIWDDGANDGYAKGYSDAKYESGVSIKKQKEKYEEFREQVADLLKLITRVWITDAPTILEEEVIRALIKYHEPEIDLDFLEQVFDEYGC